MPEFKSFIEEYDSQYAGRLAKRSAGFREIFKILESREKKYYRIIETGMLRRADNWEGDGQSTVLFDRFVNFHDGSVFSVDIDARAIAVTRTLVSFKTHCVCSDSVRFLHSLSQFHSENVADLLYLDSFDLDVNDPAPSMLHHVKEMLAVGTLKSGTIVAVDDNLVIDGRPVGKGQMIDEYFTNVGVQAAYRDYQIVWVIP